MAQTRRRTGSAASVRRRAVIEAAEKAGLLRGDAGRIGARVRRSLLSAAKANSGITSDTELIEYALAAVALEDDFGAKLLARRGSIARDLDLEL